MTGDCRESETGNSVRIDQSIDLYTCLAERAVMAGHVHVIHQEISRLKDRNNRESLAGVLAAEYRADSRRQSAVIPNCFNCSLRRVSGCDG